MDTETRHVFIPIMKSEDGQGYNAILSSNSLDRDNEYIHNDLLKEWATGGTLPMLANHANNMQSLIGAWTDRKYIEVGGKGYLTMKPNFFSKETNPLAEQVRLQVEEASKRQLQIGTSIGFIPKEHIVDATGKYGHTKAELLEGSIVPVQSNRDAIIYTTAKSFALDSLKKTTDEPTAGGKMAPTLDELQAKSAQLEKENSELKAKTAELDAATKAEVEKHEKEIAELKTSIKTIEDANTKTIEDYKAKLADANKKLEQPKGKMPAHMVGKDGSTLQNKEEKFDATKAYLLAKGIDVDKVEGKE